MENQKISAEKITKPIQLLAAWLIGLIVLVGALITGATLVTKPTWIPIFFSVSAVLIIPLFLYLIFQLQTKYRPQMQEDSYYSEYLNSNTLTMESKAMDKISKSLSITVNEKIRELALLQEEQLKEIDQKLNTLIPSNTLGEESVMPSAEKMFKDAHTDVHVNEKLENFESIENILFENKITHFEVFGAKHAKPKLFVMSFGEDTEVELVKNLVKQLPVYGLTHVRSADDSFQSNNLYIGSFAFGNVDGVHFEVLKLSDKVIEKILSFKTTAQICSYIRRNAE